MRRRVSEHPPKANSTSSGEDEVTVVDDDLEDPEAATRTETPYLKPIKVPPRVHALSSPSLSISTTVSEMALEHGGALLQVKRGRVKEEEVSDGALSHAEVYFSDEDEQPPPKKRKPRPDTKGKGGRKQKPGTRTYFDEISTRRNFDRQENWLLAQIKMRGHGSVRARVKRKRS